MVASSLASGLRAARREPCLALVIWALNLALALSAGAPGWAALADALGPLPGADVLAEGLSLSVIADLLELRPGLLTSLAYPALAAAVLGLALGLAVSGGALEVLTCPRDTRSFAHRFGRGAGRFYGRFLRLALAVGLVAAVAAALTAGPLLALQGRLLRESGNEALTLGAALLAALAAGLVVLLALLVQDAARVRVVREDARRVLPVLWQSARLVLGHPAKWLSVWAVNAVLVAGALAAYLALAAALGPGPAPSAARLGALLLLQQLFVLTRSFLRVALLGAQVQLVSALRPLPPAAPQADPEPLAPPSELEGVPGPA